MRQGSKEQSSDVSSSTSARGGCLNCQLPPILEIISKLHTGVGGGGGWGLHTVNWDRAYTTTKLYGKSNFNFF